MTFFGESLWEATYGELQGAKDFVMGFHFSNRMSWQIRMYEGNSSFEIIEEYQKIEILILPFLKLAVSDFNPFG